MVQKYEEKKLKPNKKRKKIKKVIKRGFCKKTGKQIWYDKEKKKYFFKKYSRRGYSQTKKNKAVEMAKEGIGFRKIGRLLNVSHVSAYNWVKNFCNTLQKPTLPRKCKEIELDEIWHFCQKKREKFGYGRQ